MQPDNPMEDNHSGDSARARRPSLAANNNLSSISAITGDGPDRVAR